MSTVTNNTTLDDEADATTTTTPGDSSLNVQGVGSFVMTLVILFLWLILHVSLGSLALFLGKVSQANLLPTNVYCEPYTTQFSSPTQIPIPTFPVGDTTSYITFDTLQWTASEEGTPLLTQLREMNNPSSSSSPPSLFVELIQALTFPLMAQSCRVVTSLFHGLHSLLPESFMIWLGPLFLGCILSIALFLNQFYGIYLWFSSWVSLLMERNGHLLGGILSFWVVLFSLIGFAFVFPLVGFFTVFTVGYTLLLSLQATYTSRGSEPGASSSSFGVSSFVWNTLSYSKVTITTLFALGAIVAAFGSMGTVSGLFCLATVALIYWEVLPLGLFHSIPSRMMGEVVTPENKRKMYKQATKTDCAKPGSSTPQQARQIHGWLWRLYSMIVG